MIELNKIYCESNSETMSRMENNFIDLTITSPPYDELRDYKGYSFDFKTLAKELFRVTKEGGVVVWNVADATINGSETGTSFRQALYFKDVGFNLHDTMVWIKPNPMPVSETQKRYSSAFEYMFILSKGSPKTFNPIKEKSLNHGKTSGTSISGVRNKDGSLGKKDVKIKKSILEEKIISNVFSFASAYSKESVFHPAPFPDNMAKKHLITWSNKNDLVYDPFMGSGTTAKCAIDYGRNWIGSEISKEYCVLANKRLEPYLQQPKLF